MKKHVGVDLIQMVQNMVQWQCFVNRKKDSESTPRRNICRVPS